MSAVNDGSPINPNEYNDGAYTDASMEMGSHLPSSLNDFWEAGASISNIESEIASAIENSDIPPSGMLNVRVSITIQE